MTTRGWVETNGSYGYGCACFDMDVDKASKNVTLIRSARPIPLSKCQKDPNLSAPQ
jgi:hypothetical protein